MKMAGRLNRQNSVGNRAPIPPEGRRRAESAERPATLLETEREMFGLYDRVACSVCGQDTYLRRRSPHAADGDACERLKLPRHRHLTYPALTDRLSLSARWAHMRPYPPSGLFRRIRTRAVGAAARKVERAVDSGCSCGKDSGLILFPCERCKKLEKREFPGRPGGTLKCKAALAQAGRQRFSLR
jgi:hypothetical protein